MMKTLTALLTALTFVFGGMAYAQEGLECDQVITCGQRENRHPENR